MMNNTTDLKKTIENFSKSGIKIGFGFEFECYILNQNNQPVDQNIFMSLIKDFLLQNQFPAVVTKELEFGQIEIISIVNFDLINTIDKWNEVLNELKSLFALKNFQINHLAKPFLNKAGNGLHINISLHDLTTQENLFGCKDFTAYNCFDSNFHHPDISNSLLAYSVGGTLRSIKNNPYNYLYNSSIIDRIKNPDMHSPRNISWGYNNRTTLLRIPESLPNTKRLENRLPSAENDLLQTTIVMLNNVYNGIVNKVIPQRCTFGLAYDEQYNLDSLL